jgi:uncharacterized BrkB/YihY/UPF0761 family membrane protein
MGRWGDRINSLPYLPTFPTPALISGGCGKIRAMAKRFLHWLSVGAWANALAIYGSGRLWREVVYQARRSRWAEVAAAVAFLWLLGLLGGGFVVLHLGQNRALWLPPGSLELGRSLQAGLAIPEPDANTLPLNRWGLGPVGLGAWLCLVAGTQKLVQLVRAVYSSAPTAHARWRTRLLPWGATLLGLGVTGLVFSLVSHDRTLSQPGPAHWGEQLGRWIVSLGGVALSLALLYRLAPSRPLPGLPLWPGVRLSVALGLVILGLRQWGLSGLAAPAIAYHRLLALGLNLGALYIAILLVPLGAQVNLSTLHYRGEVRRPWGVRAPAPPPPSFESFKIKRRD